MSVTYVVLAHRDPEQLARLVRRLLPGGHSVVVHVDARTDVSPFVDALGELVGEDVVLVADRVVCQWADYSLVEATLRGLRTALALTPDASHLVLLSGQCYPIEPAERITTFFAENRGRSFLFASSGAGEAWSAIDRTGNERWAWDGRLNRLGRFHVRVGHRLLAVPNRFTPGWPYRRMPHGLRPMQGSQWFALDAAAAAWVLDYLERRPDVVRFFRRVLAPDENVVQMVLEASPHRGSIVQDDLHYISWAREHPRDLRLEDVDLLLDSPKLFARKVDATTGAALLDRLDALHAVAA